MISPDEVAAVERDLKTYIDAAEPDAELVNPGVEMFFAGVRHVTGLTGNRPRSSNRCC